jgi:sRNA-binding protein
VSFDQSLMYRRSLVAGAIRVGLDGRAVGEVETAHAAHAQRIVTRIEASGPAEASDGRYTTEKTAGNAEKSRRTSLSADPDAHSPLPKDFGGDLPTLVFRSHLCDRPYIPI